MYKIESKFNTLRDPGWVWVGTRDTLEDAKALADAIYVRTARVTIDGSEIYCNDA